MINIIITNLRTAIRKLRNILLAGLVIGGAYLSTDFIEKATKLYERNNAHSIIKSYIGDEDYIASRERLFSLGSYLTLEETKDLEAKIQNIYPDSLLAKSQHEDLGRQKYLTLKAREAYLALGKGTFEANKKYVEASFNELREELNHPFAGRSESNIIKNLEKVKNDSIFNELVNFKTQRLKVHEPILDSLVYATGNFIKSFSPNYVSNVNYGSYIEYIKPAITYTLDISLGIDPSRYKKDIKFLIDTYAEIIKLRMEITDYARNVLKTLAELKKLQESYKYKNQIIDEDKFLLDYVSKL